MRRETYIGIAIEILGSGTGTGLQMTEITSATVGWVIIIISSVVGLIMIGYGIRKKDDKGKLIETQQLSVEPPTEPVVQLQEGSIDTVTLQDRRFIRLELSVPMQWRHGHMDTEGLLADRASGVPLNELLARNCSRCGVPRNKKGRRY